MISQPNSLTMKELAVLTILVNRFTVRKIYYIIHTTKNRKMVVKTWFIFSCSTPPLSCFLSFVLLKTKVK